MSIPKIRKTTFPSLASNEMRARQNYSSREVYHLGYFNDDRKELKKYVIDLWYDKPLYGRIDEQQNIVVINPSAMKLLEPPVPTYAANFVVDAFEKFKEFFDRAFATSRISRKTFLGSVIPQKAWADPDLLYNSYMKNLYTDTVRNRVNFSSGYKRIHDLRSFLSFMFMEKDVIGNADPFTRLGFLSSRNVSPNASGLAIEVADLDVSNDVDKDFFVGDANFRFFLLHARRFGFYVDKNCPWRLIANPRSTAMIPRMNAYGIDDYVDLFKKSYSLAYKDDFNVFKIMATMFYESYRRANPTFRFGHVCVAGKEPVSRVYRLTRKTLDDHGVTDDELFYYYLISRFMEYYNDRHSAIKKSNSFLKQTKNDTIEQRIERLNIRLNKHPDITIPRTPGSGECVKHRMPNGAIMEGPVHGPGQVCVEWAQAGSVTTGDTPSGGGYSGGGSGGY